MASVDYNISKIILIWMLCDLFVYTLYEQLRSNLVKSYLTELKVDKFAGFKLVRYISDVNTLQVTKLY